jgi:hypothetical protein
MKKVILFIALLLAAIQFVPISRTNPAEESPLEAPAPVAALLKRACFNCHSHQTVWPWYSRVAPASWLLASDVTEGRSELNFSSWGKYLPEKRLTLAKELVEDLASGEMPPWYYLPLHPEGRLTPEELGAIKEWAEGLK